jgi:hypothetical protein
MKNIKWTNKMNENEDVEYISVDWNSSAIGSLGYIV